MKIFVKILIVSMMLSASVNTFAQVLGVKAGLNLSNVLAKDDNKTYSDDNKMKPGFHLGVTAEIPFEEMFSFETGLLFTQKGYKYESSFMGTTYEGTLNLNYIEIPLNGKVSYDMGSAKIYGLIGPYVGFGLSGKYKNDDEDSKVDWGSDEDEDDFKRLDFGLNVGAGVEIDALTVGISYGLGLANISPYSDGGYKVNNRVLAISIGYKLTDLLN
jgi:opacity protein-like surface antigen